MSAIRAIIKLVATEKVGREIDNVARLQLDILQLGLIESDSTFILREYLRSETSKFIARMKKIYEHIYLKELEEMYYISQYSLVSSKINIPNCVWQ